MTAQKNKIKYSVSCHTVCETLMGRLSLSSFSLICPSKQVVSCVILQPLSFQFLLFHSSVLEPDLHLTGAAENRKDTGLMIRLFFWKGQGLISGGVYSQQLIDNGFITDDSVGIIPLIPPSQLI